MARTPDEIKAILDNFKDNASKLDALKMLTDLELPGAAPDTSLATLEAWLDNGGYAGPGVQIADRVAGIIHDLESGYPTEWHLGTYANMAWSLGYDGNPRLQERPPLGPSDDPWSDQLPGAHHTNSCDEARKYWRAAALILADLAHDAIAARDGRDERRSKEENPELALGIAISVAKATPEPGHYAEAAGLQADPIAVAQAELDAARAPEA